MKKPLNITIEEEVQDGTTFLEKIVEEYEEEKNDKEKPEQKKL